MSAVTDFMAAVQAHEKGDFAKAERLYRSLTRSMPFQANQNLGVTLLAQNRFKAAETAFNAALAAQPGDPRPLFNLGQLRLAEGDYAAGWPLWEHRRGVPGMVRDAPKLEAPEWTGQPLAGKRLAIVGEQGLGDQLMNARFVPAVARLAGEAVFAAAPPLHPVFQALGVPVVDEKTLDPKAFDHWVLLGSLPGRLGATLQTLPPPARLSVPANSAGGGIGVVPSGNPGHKANLHRSLFGRDAERLLRLGRDLRPEATGAKDFAETAAIVAGLDLVISVDTAVAHLAAAMGKPAWILLQSVETDWRWLRDREDSPWYPSARLFRQRTAGDWAPVFRRIETALANR